MAVTSDGIDFSKLRCPHCQSAGLEKSSDMYFATATVRWHFRCPGCGTTGHLGWDQCDPALRSITFCHVETPKTAGSREVQ